MQIFESDKNATKTRTYARFWTKKLIEVASCLYSREARGHIGLLKCVSRERFSSRCTGRVPASSSLRAQMRILTASCPARGNAEYLHCALNITVRALTRTEFEWRERGSALAGSGSLDSCRERHLLDYNCIAWGTKLFIRTTAETTIPANHNRQMRWNINVISI